MAKKNFKSLLFCSLLLFASLGHAIDQVEITGRPYFLLGEDGSFSQCGMRFLILTELETRNQRQVGFVYDGSMAVYSEGHVFIKGSAFRATYDKNGTMQAKGIALKTYWIKSEGFNATVPFEGKTIRGEDGLSIIYLDKDGLDKYTKMVTSVANKEPLLIGGQLQGEKIPHAFSGIVRISESDLRSFLSCNKELMQKWRVPTSEQ